MNFNECIDKFIKEVYIGENFTCNGVCNKCGECCGIILPIDQEDADKIQEYVIKNGIYPQRQVLVMKNKLQCPYYTGNKEKGCAVYEARPKICRIYKCDKKKITLEEVQVLKKAIPVDMWAFAQEIERRMKRHGINQKTRKTVD